MPPATASRSAAVPDLPAVAALPFSGAQALVGSDMAKACVAAFLGTDFAGGRHQCRVDKLSNPVFTKEPACAHCRPASSRTSRGRG